MIIDKSISQAWLTNTKEMRRYDVLLLPRSHRSCPRSNHLLVAPKISLRQAFIQFGDQKRAKLRNLKIPWKILATLT